MSDTLDRLERDAEWWSGLLSTLRVCEERDILALNREAQRNVIEELAKLLPSFSALVAVARAAERLTVDKFGALNARDFYAVREALAALDRPAGEPQP